MNICRRLQFPSTKDVICLQTERLGDKILSSSTLDNKTRLKIKSFRASAGWCSRFTNQYRMKSRVLYESAGNEEVEQATRE